MLCFLKQLPTTVSFFKTQSLRHFYFFTGIRLGTIHVVISLTPEEKQPGRTEQYLLSTCGELSASHSLDVRS